MMTNEAANELKSLIKKFISSKEYHDIVSFMINNDCQGLSNYPELERMIDDVASFAGWIYDTAEKDSKRKITSKIRKALGYTYP